MGGRRRYGSIRKLPSGRFQVRFLAADGPHTAPETFANKTDAARHLAFIEADLDRGLWVDPQAGQVSLADWGTRFLRAQQARLKPKTHASELSLFRSRIKPTFGTVPLANIRQIDVREWVNQMMVEGLSSSRIRQALGLLSRIMRAAEEDRMIVANPCRAIRPPRLPVTDPRILTQAEVNELRAAMREPLPILVDLLVFGGLRVGELFALRRGHVDIEGSRLLVQQSISEVGGHRTVQDPKNHHVRPITLDAGLLVDLVTYLADHVGPEADALLFPNRRGKPRNYNAFRRSVWDPAVAGAGLSDITPHDLRATCASWVADAFGPIEAARRLGHSSASITTRHYARPVAGRDLDVAEALGRLRTGEAPKRERPPTRES